MAENQFVFAGAQFKAIIPGGIGVANHGAIGDENAHIRNGRLAAVCYETTNREILRF